MRLAAANYYTIAKTTTITFIVFLANFINVSVNSPAVCFATNQPNKKKIMSRNRHRKQHQQQL